MKIHIKKLTGPAYWAPYLINGDASGYSDEEIEEIDQAVRGLGPCVGCETDETDFRYYSDLSPLGGDVCVYTFQILRTARREAAYRYDFGPRKKPSAVPASKKRKA